MLALNAIDGQEGGGVCVLALDLGTKTGVAIRGRDGHVRHYLKEWPNAGNVGFRYAQFRRWLVETKNRLGDIDAVYYEEAAFMGASVQNARVKFGLEATLTAWCEHHQIPYRGVGPGTIKKFITGSGNAKKPAVIAAVQQLGFRVEDDNVADAIALLMLAMDRMETGVVLPKPDAEMACTF